MRAIGIVSAICLLAGGGWWGYSALFAQGSSDVFILHTLSRGDIVRTISATGTVEPLVKVIVGAQVSGRIKAWNADFNDRVAQGELLAEIEPDRFEMALAQAKADVDLAKARAEELRVRFEDADRELKRIAPLREQNIASDNEYQVAKANAEATKAAWDGGIASAEASEARLRAAEVDLGYCQIRSPIDGVVISRTIDVGQTVASSFQTPELFLIANDLTRMQVYANISESDIGLIAEGMPAKFRVDAHPDKDFTGTISQIRYNATILDGVVTYVTLIEVANEEMLLRPGMTANVTVEVEKAENVLCVPNAALRFNPGPRESLGGRSGQAPKRRSPTVYVLENDKPKPIEVKIGMSDGSSSALLDDSLREGMQIITERDWAAMGGRKAAASRRIVD